MGSSRILVFAGAGASRAVSAEKYPTTVEFFDRLPDSIKSDAFFRLAVQYLRSRGGDDPIDIEQVLWLCRDLQGFLSAVLDDKSIPGWFVRERRLNTLAARGEDIAQLPTVAEPASQRVRSLMSQINTIVYDLYGDEPDESELKDNWIRFLSGLRQFGLPIEIATTNYDVVLEHAIGFAQVPVDTGRLPGIHTKVVLSPWPPLEETLNGRLLKLHGSVDWVRRGSRIYVGAPIFSGNHERHAIVYPGFKGVPLDPELHHAHLYFESVLRQTRLAVFIGYAFRDEYLNALMSRSLSPTADIVVLNPAKELSGMPFATTRVHRKIALFDRDGVDDLIGVILQSMHRRTLAGS